MTSVLKFKRRALAACAIALVLSGCSSSNSILTRAEGLVSPASESNSASTPNVRNCLIVNGATGDITKTEYVCNGKTYTSDQLYKLREKANSN